MPRKNKNETVPGHVLDAYAPAEMAARVERIGVIKAKLATVPTLALGLLAGALGTVLLVYWSGHLTLASTWSARRH